MSRSSSPRIWFITGTSKGFGRIRTEAALARGDSVVAAPRNIAALCSLKAQYGDSLLPIALDVGDKAAVDDAVRQARDQFGRIVDADEPPLRVFFGRDGLPMTRREYADRIATWEKWNDVALEAQGTVAAT